MSEANQNSLQRNGDRAVSVGAPIEVSKEIGEAVLEEIGGFKLNKPAIKQMAEIGIDAASYGLLSIAGGAIVIAAPMALDILTELHSVVKTTKSQKIKIAGAIAAATILKSIQGLCAAVKADGLAAPTKPQRTGPKKVFAAQIAQPPSSVAAA